MRCIRATGADPLPSFEILVINDGSTDQSPALLEKFACREPRLRVLHRPQAGTAASSIPSRPTARPKKRRTGWQRPDTLHFPKLI
ncbi:glycosyltransferase [Desulfovibrio sp. ZJ200]|uniref:glycosyltransferase n=1 Tax=Desulfovibrio sp. ZJ200 TaxID=2709792 RepID=UPI0013EA103B|nr:glycosyltransferase [Desulfovibrio sp. ZJ200]